MGVAGRCSICGKVCTPCITCALCGRLVCQEHQRNGVCLNCLGGRKISGKEV